MRPITSGWPPKCWGFAVRRTRWRAGSSLRRWSWRTAGRRGAAPENRSAGAPALPGDYIPATATDVFCGVGKAVNLRRRLRALLCGPALACQIGPASRARTLSGGSIGDRGPSDRSHPHPGAAARRQRTGAPDRRRGRSAATPSAIVVVVNRSRMIGGALAARTDGGWMLQRTRRNGADLPVHAARLRRFFGGPGPPRLRWRRWFFVAGRPGAAATRLDPHDVRRRANFGRGCPLLADEPVRRTAHGIFLVLPARRPIASWIERLATNRRSQVRVLLGPPTEKFIHLQPRYRPHPHHQVRRRKDILDAILDGIQQTLEGDRDAGCPGY